MNLKKVSIVLVIVTSLAMVNCKEKKEPISGNSFPVQEAIGTEYQVDPENSTIQWVGTKITGRHNGIVKIKSGYVKAAEENITGGKFTLDMSTISVTDLEGDLKDKLEKHLRTEDFFEIEKFPEAVFEIASTSKNSDAVLIKGNLTMRGITHGIEFPASIVWEAGKPLSAKATLTFDRQKWGIVYKGKVDDLISDTVSLDLDLKTL